MLIAFSGLRGDVLYLESGCVASSIVLVPVLWLAPYGQRAMIAISAAASGLTCVFPVLVVGSPEYPSTELRRGFWMFASGPVTGDGRPPRTGGTRTGRPPRSAGGGGASDHAPPPRPFLRLASSIRYPGGNTKR
jgi:hypothetical protein